MANGRDIGRGVGATAGSFGGAALGNILLPGVGGIAGRFVGGAVGGVLGGAVGGLFGGGGKAPATPEEASRARLRAVTDRLLAESGKDPYATAAYQTRVGEARDAAREDSQSDAARALTMGTSGGAAIAAGAGERARALAGVQRAAAGDAE
ncbi:MAG TPA: hypothetical protein VF576_01790, partial [Rubricoccaceae bacterium]